MLLPPGTYLSGTIRLKSNVTRQLENGAVLLGSPDNADYDRYETLPFKSVSDNETTYFHYSLSTADGAHNIALEGCGVVHQPQEAQRTQNHRHQDVRAPAVSGDPGGAPAQQRPQESVERWSYRLAGLSETSKCSIVVPPTGFCSPGRFYRGGLQISGLWVLCSGRSISISCNVALGEPNFQVAS